MIFTYYLHTYLHTTYTWQEINNNFHLFYNSCCYLPMLFIKNSLNTLLQKYKRKYFHCGQTSYKLWYIRDWWVQQMKNTKQQIFYRCAILLQDVYMSLTGPLSHSFDMRERLLGRRYQPVPPFGHPSVILLLLIIPVYEIWTIEKINVNCPLSSKQENNSQKLNLNPLLTSLLSQSASIK